MPDQSRIPPYCNLRSHRKGAWRGGFPIYIPCDVMATSWGFPAVPVGLVQWRAGTLIHGGSCSQVWFCEHGFVGMSLSLCPFVSYQALALRCNASLFVQSKVEAQQSITISDHAPMVMSSLLPGIPKPIRCWCSNSILLSDGKFIQFIEEQIAFFKKKQ